MSCVVNHQSTPFAALLRFVCQAAVSRRSVSKSGIQRHRHCRLSTLSSISAMFNQLPCLSVNTNSKREQNRCASAASNALYNAASLCVLKLSDPKITRFAVGYTSSNTIFTSYAQFIAARRSCPDTLRHPESASVNKKIVAVPLRLYSESIRNTRPGLMPCGTQILVNNAANLIFMVFVSAKLTNT